TLPRVWPRQRLRGIAAALAARGRVAQSGGRADRAKAETAVAGDEWRVPRAAAAARIARCIYLHSPSPDPRDGGPPAEPQLGAPFQDARGNVAAFCGPARSDRKYAGAFVAAAIHAERSGLPIS